jgi:predicted amidohydrolase
MNQRIKIAITQMNVSPDVMEKRLSRAEKMVHEAAIQGADLVVLPELFNTGYAYQDSNFAAAKEGNHTNVWMKRMSVEHDVFLAGSYLFAEQKKIVNRLTLTAPDGKSWHYDKTFPWGWERAYFQSGSGIQIADTPLGRIGFMLCWDVAHADLWRQYAGKVDMIVSCTCPPNIPDGLYCFPDGSQFKADQLGWLFRRMQHSARQVFIETPAQQCRWLGVPYISSTGSGKINTPVPNPKGSFLGALFSKPVLIGKFNQSAGLSIQAEMVEAARIYNANGDQLLQLENTAQDEFKMTELEIENHVQRPVVKQPTPNIPGLVYLVSDGLLPAVSRSTYRRGLRKLDQL